MPRNGHRRRTLEDKPETNHDVTMKRLSLFALIALIATCRALAGGEGHRPGIHRMIVLSDIENEPDDTESFVRLMLYSNDIDLKGLVASTLP